MTLSTLEQDILNRPAACSELVKFLLANNPKGFNQSDQYTLILFLLAYANNKGEASELAKRLKPHPNWQELVQYYPTLAETQCLITHDKLLAIIKTVANKFKDAAAKNPHNLAARSKRNALETIIHEWGHLTLNDLRVLLQDTDICEAFTVKYQTTAVIPVGFILQHQENLSLQLPNIPASHNLINLMNDLKRRQRLRSIEKRQKKLTSIEFASDSITAIDEKFNTLFTQLNIQQWVPPAYLCPLTRQVMQEPVTLHDGYTFERLAIIEHFKTSITNPVTGTVLESGLFVNNYALKSLINNELDTLSFLPTTKRATPGEYKCSISYCIMVKPVIVNDGQTYEYDEITKWIERQGNNARSPNTQKVIDTNIFFPNLALQELIRDYLNSHPELYEQDEVYLPQAYQDLMYQAIISRNLVEIKRLASINKRLLTHIINNGHSALWYMLNEGWDEKEIICFINQYKIQVNLIEDLFSVCSLAIRNKYQSLLKQYLLTTSTHTTVKASDSTTGHTLLHIAIIVANKLAIKLLLQLGADIHAKSKDNSSTLIYAAQSYNEKLFIRLLDRGVDVKIKDKKGCSALYYCMNSPNPLAWIHSPLWVKFREHLIDQKLIANGSRLIHAAVYLEDLPLLRCLIASYYFLNRIKQDYSFIYGQDENGNTPLHLAAQIDHDLCTDHLIQDYPEQVEILNKKNEFPLNTAIKSKSPQVTQRLLRNSRLLALSSLNTENLKFLFNQLRKNNTLETLELKDCHITTSSINELKTTLIANPRLNKISFSDCKFEFSAIQGFVGLIINLIISKSRVFAIELPNIKLINRPTVISQDDLNIARSIFMQIYALENTNLAQALLRIMLVSLGLREEASVLHLAAYLLDDTSLLLSLLKEPSLTESCDNHGDTPLHYAVAAKRKSAIRALLNKNPKIAFKPNRQGFTPLSLAYADKEVRKLFLPLETSITYPLEDESDFSDLMSAIASNSDLESLTLTNYKLNPNNLHRIFSWMGLKDKFKHLSAEALELNSYIILKLNSRKTVDNASTTRVFNITFDGFNLANEEMSDWKISKAIKAINKYSFKYLNLSNARLTSSKHREFYQAIAASTTIEKIDMTNNYLSEERIIGFAEAFKTNRTVKVLKLTGSKITDSIALKLIETFKQHSKLEVLEIDKSQISYPIRHALSNSLQADVIKQEGKLIFTRRLPTSTPKVDDEGYLRKLQRKIKKTKWEIGFFGGDKVRIGDKDMVVPKGVRLILDAIKEAQLNNKKEAWSTAKNKIADIAKERRACKHTFFNRQYESTTKFYDNIIIESAQAALTA